MKHPFSQKVVVSGFVFALSTVLITKPTYGAIQSNEQQNKINDNKLVNINGNKGNITTDSTKFDDVTLSNSNNTKDKSDHSGNSSNSNGTAYIDQTGDSKLSDSDVEPASSKNSNVQDGKNYSNSDDTKYNGTARSQDLGQPDDNTNDNNDNGAQTDGTKPNDNTSDNNDGSQTGGTKPDDNTSDNNDGSQTGGTKPDDNTSDNNDGSQSGGMKPDDNTNDNNDGAQSGGVKPDDNTNDNNDGAQTDGTKPDDNTSDNNDNGAQSGGTKPNDNSSNNNDGAQTGGTKPNDNTSDNNDGAQSGGVKPNDNTNDNNDNGAQSGGVKPDDNTNDNNDGAQSGGVKPDDNTNDNNDGTQTDGTKPDDNTSDNNDNGAQSGGTKPGSDATSNQGGNDTQTPQQHSKPNNKQSNKTTNNDIATLEPHQNIAGQEGNNVSGTAQKQHKHVQSDNPNTKYNQNNIENKTNKLKHNQYNNATNQLHNEHSNQYSSRNDKGVTYGDLSVNENQQIGNHNDDTKVVNRFKQMSTGSFKYNPYVINQVRALNNKAASVTDKEISAVLKKQSFEDNAYLNSLQKGTNYFKFQYFNPLKSSDYYKNLDKQVLALITGDIGSMPDLKNPKTKSSSGKYEYHSSSEEELTDTQERNANTTIDIKFERTLFALITAMIIISIGMVIGYLVHRRK